MFVTAVRPREELFVYPPTWTFSEFRWENFVDMWVKTNFGGALLNSLYVSITATVLALVLSIPAAYAMSRYRFAGKGAYRTLPADDADDVAHRARARPVPADDRRLAWSTTSTRWCITYAAFNMAFTIWMLQSYFNTIPRDLEEAAWMDGASHLTSLVRVFLPLAMPADGGDRDLHLHQQLERVRAGADHDALVRSISPCRCRSSRRSPGAIRSNGTT